MTTDATISEPGGNPADPGTSADGAPSRRTRRAAVAGGVGTLIEGYDFSSYGYLSVFIAPLFFPNDDPVVSLLLTLVVFATAYLARPLGGIAFGLVGDRVDRGRVLVATILLMGVATTLIGLLPTHTTIGVTATVLLILLRLVQGFSVGAEVAGAATFVSEAAPNRYKSRFGAFNPAGATFGFGLAAAVAGLTSALTTEQQMAEWGWRIPFLISLPLTVVCFIIRRRITTESHSVATVAGTTTSLLDVVRVGRIAILKGAGLSAAVNGTAYFGLTYVSIHLIQQLGYPKTAVYWVVTVVVMITALLMLPVGRLGDRVDLPKLGAIGMVGYLAVTWVGMWLMGLGSLALAAVAFMVIMINSSFLQVTGYALSPEIYPRAIRFTGMSLGWNIGVIIAGGTAPALCVWLVEATGAPTAPAFFVMLAAAVGLVSVWAIARGPRPGRIGG
ncbi:MULTISPECIES: MFS transporter [unclassified Pseudonocardia]|uniref:MFS transporter n=1 Tax=unclassified Pseudonocardia TaxID=2619320 RepID=UPI0001FFEEA2|nr:MFS transporter [Pseudonocardia sp. Ae707_Ps1]OLM09240.1 L-Proline/Glycine betaine transporter ProP [Pseudonocardia sp. Ae707_Ps1]